MSSKKGIYILALVGLLLGVLIDFLLHEASITIFYYSFITLFGVLFALTYNDKHVIRLIGTSFIFALFLSSPLLPLKIDLGTIHYLHLFTFLIGFPFLIYVAHAYHYAFHHDNNWRVNYSTLFAAVWNTIPLLFVSTIFSILANLLIMLGAFIFKTVGSNYLWDLYLFNHDFKLITNTTLFFIGLGIGQQNIKIIYSLRYLMLRIMYYLFPFLALISGIYFVLYLIHYFSGGSDYLDPLFILLPLTGLGIIFFNAYFQDGCIETEYPVFVRFSLRVYRVILFLLVVMMAVKILGNYSLDINLFIYLLVAILFCLTYALTAWFNEEKEKKWIRIGNISIAFIFSMVLYLFNLPYMPIDLTIGSKNTLTIPSIQVKPAQNPSGD